MESIRSLRSLQASVLSNGRHRTIASTQVVPGGIVLLQSGDKVPADIRCIKVRNLRIGEDCLTG